MGITVPLMLLHRSESGRQKNLRVGVYFLLASVLVSAIGAIVMKYAADTDASPFLYLVASGIVASILGWLQRAWAHRKHTKQDTAAHTKRNN